MPFYLQDNNLVDENGNRLDGGCSRPQGHPKSPEAARKFLLDAATVFFTEQVCSVCMEFCNSFCLSYCY